VALNPFKISVVIGLVVAIAFAVWFAFVFFVDPGNNGSLNVVDESTTSESE
jgi:hypothetical protein